MSKRKTPPKEEPLYYVSYFPMEIEIVETGQKKIIKTIDQLPLLTGFRVLRTHIGVGNNRLNKAA